MDHNWSKFTLKLIWVVGLFGLILGSYHLKQMVEQQVSQNYIIGPRFWLDATMPFLFGLYISLLFIKRWTFKINIPLFLCVTVPCLIISFYTPVVYTITSNSTSDLVLSIPMPFWLFKLNSYGIAPITAGLTFLISLCGASQHQSTESKIAK
ncbi:hypothetical protein JFL43_02510 [Viridibacillus sp. YIM B01967]|uniref:Uncharacterized protein n=1 Tax=Viridibacillus soli TaxID=2798301 RepID=A0ABS1H2W3_9BACL|nr:hypothetical protein [Viridibacillus soli]MBK3493748.1 hypothetical protein [Viridibacillus soli]